MSLIWGTVNTRVKSLIEGMKWSGRLFGLKQYDNVAEDIINKMRCLFPNNLFEYEVLKLT